MTMNASILNREQTAKYRVGERALAQANDQARREAAKRYEAALDNLKAAYAAEKATIDAQYASAVDVLVAAILA